MNGFRDPYEEIAEKEQVWMTSEMAAKTLADRGVSLKRDAVEELEATTLNKDFDMVNNPHYYQNGGLETIEVIEGALTYAEVTGYMAGNILKYVSRYKRKGMPIKDLQKAEWYLKRLIKTVERHEGAAAK